VYTNVTDAKQPLKLIRPPSRSLRQIDHPFLELSLCAKQGKPLCKMAQLLQKKFIVNI
jgi:hypothetical protein